MYTVSIMYVRTIGETDTGESIEAISLSQLTLSRAVKCANSIVKIARRTPSKEFYDLGAPLYGLVDRRYTLTQMYKKAGSSACDALYINGDLVGISERETKSAGTAPIAVTRPRESSESIDFWLTPPYRDDSAANKAVASTLVHPQSSVWQWTFLNPHFDEAKTASYSELGLTIAESGEDWIRFFDGGGIRGQDLWAKKPSTDDPLIASAMQELASVTEQVYGPRDAAQDARFAAMKDSPDL